MICNYCGSMINNMDYDNNDNVYQCPQCGATHKIDCLALKEV